MVALNNPSPHADREIIITRTFAFPRELVWEAMTNPEHVINWWGPRGFTTTIEEMKVRPGGTWKHVMHGPDGIDYPNKSIFTEVEKPARLVYTHAGSKAGGPGISFVSTWTFDALGADRTKVTIRMVFPSTNERDRVANEFGAIEGGRQTLERLGEFLIRKGEPLVVERTYPASVEAVWKALTDREAMSQWYFELKEFRPEVGFEFGFVVEWDDKRYDHRCRVTEVIPGKKIAYTWRYEGYAGDSLVTFELFDEKGSTRLRVTHEGLDNLPKVPDLTRDNFNTGWNSLIGEKLGKFLSGKV